jgi:hypothetical protein
MKLACGEWVVHDGRRQRRHRSGRESGAGSQWKVAGRLDSKAHSPSEPRCGPGTWTKITAGLRDLRPLSMDSSRPKVARPPPMARPALSDLGLSLGRHAVVTWAMATTGKRRRHRIASPLDCGKQGQQKQLLLSRMRRAPCCGKRRAGRRAAWWRQLIGEGQLSWHAGRCWARRRRQVPSLWFWVVDGADWPVFRVPAAKTGALGKDKSGADMQGQLSGSCGPERDKSRSETTSTGRSNRTPVGLDAPRTKGVRTWLCKC